MLGKLPQAHTCTNTLELPNYYESLQETAMPPVASCHRLSSLGQCQASHEKPNWIPLVDWLYIKDMDRLIYM
jgi:hypothetical protein